MFEVREYHWTMRCAVEDFRQKTVLEGNDALPLHKYNPDFLDGQSFYVVGENEIASLAVLEQDHYATEDDRVLRACRFHTLKKYRNHALGTKLLLPSMIEWASKRDYDCVYWTHDVNNRALNAIYQKKKNPGHYSHLKDDKFWNKLQFDDRWLFQVDPKSDLLQYVYYIPLKDNYKMKPKKCVVWNEYKT